MIVNNTRRIMADKRIDGISDLMKASGLSRNAVDKLFKDIDIESLKMRTLFTLCDALGCKLSDLLEYVPEKEGKNN